MIIILTEEDIRPAYKEGTEKIGLEIFDISQEQILKSDGIVVFLKARKPYILKAKPKMIKILAQITKH